MGHDNSQVILVIEDNSFDRELLYWELRKTLLSNLRENLIAKAEADFFSSTRNRVDPLNALAAIVHKEGEGNCGLQKGNGVSFLYVFANEIVGLSLIHGMLPAKG